MKVTNLLISQPKPVGDSSPYFDLAEKLKLNFTFRQFIKIVGVSTKDFRAQHINLPDYTAVIFTSKIGIDNFFRIAKEVKYAVPETLKYFCTTEQIALYLQKYIVYRKRKIFHGKNTFNDTIDALKKNISEKFLLITSDVSSNEIPDFLNSVGIKFDKCVMYQTVSAELDDIKADFPNFQVLVFFTPAGIKSLHENFPDFEQGDVKIAAFGHSAWEAVEKYGYRLDIKAPTEEAKSMPAALEQFIIANNKKK
ncbi:MAG: uroporphyrinogen-III synthase [Bacteroidales bacterium]|nr:uroporphyrinogen-III synthase [Bacteroidales bacterium]